MNHDVNIRDEEIAARAAAWVVRLRADDVSIEDMEAAAVWLEADAAHRAVFDEAEALWTALDHTPAAAPVIDLAARRARRTWPGVRWPVAAPAIAAAVAAALLLAPLLRSVPVQTYRTAPGEIRVVTLDDGSRLQINGGSTLSVRMERGRRLVRMEQAEAAFDVAHDPNRPFLVEVGESEVRVVGTAFNIRRSGGDTRVSVLRGVVEVSDLEASARKVRLTVGQQVERDDAADHMAVASTDPATTAAWTQGRRVYDDRPLSEVAADLSRAFATPVSVAPDAAGLRFSGVLVFDDEQAVLNRLEGFLPIRAAREGAGVRLERR